MLLFEKEFPQAIDDISKISYFLLPDEIEFLRFAYKVRKPVSTADYYAVLIGLEIGRIERKVDDFLRKAITSLEPFRELEKQAKKVGAKASYKRAFSILKRLEKWGFLKRRPVEHMKEKFFWVLNPGFLQKYTPQLQKIWGD
jgi:hypothetical protein